MNDGYMSTIPKKAKKPNPNQKTDMKAWKETWILDPKTETVMPKITGQPMPRNRGMGITRAPSSKRLPKREMLRHFRRQNEWILREIRSEGDELRQGEGNGTDENGSYPTTTRTV